MLRAVLPILYSFVRCPYAMRARLALAYARIDVEHREVSLRAKPAALIKASPKGTVPVLVLEDGTVLEQSLDIMRWACAQRDDDAWLPCADEALLLLRFCDDEWKPLLDRAKYADRYPELSQAEHREKAWAFIRMLEARLEESAHLSGARRGFVDAAIFPFVRQLMRVDEPWFRARASTALRTWLDAWTHDALFVSVMTKHAVWADLS